MPDRIVDWLARGGVLNTVLGATALLLGVLAWSIKTAGPELRAWVTMLWERRDAKAAAAIEGAIGDAEQFPDAA